MEPDTLKRLVKPVSCLVLDHVVFFSVLLPLADSTWIFFVVNI